VGASPPPFPLSVQQARAQVAEVVQRAPVLCGFANRSRWWLAGVRQRIPWLGDCCLATVWRTLRRLGLVYKRGRRHVHSPDPDYASKLQRVAAITWYSRQAPQQIVRLYEDEVTYYRKASVATAFAPRGGDQPRAEQGWGTNTSRRIAGCLDAASGALFSWQRAHFDAPTLLRFYQALEEAYPHADQLFLIQDNWPCHTALEVREGLRDSKITLVPLPTYAPWTNPIEKVWRKLYAEVWHLHPWVDAWDQLQTAVQTWLDHYTAPSETLLRYVGLACPP
jgi:hypothetical protein